MKTLRDIGEDELIRRIIEMMPTGTGAGEGPGDDCSVVDNGGKRLLLLKTDALVEGVHIDETCGSDRRRLEGGCKGLFRFRSHGWGG